MSEKTICLFSGGLDSTACLYFALDQGYEVYALTVHYGQLHEVEIQCAEKMATQLKVPHEVVKVPLPWKASSLLTRDIPIPKNRSVKSIPKKIPSTYVPARNTLLLALAASYAESIGAQRILIGANALDYSGYPDCRSDFFTAFSEVIKQGTQAGVDGKKILIEAPLLHMSKSEIVEFGIRLKVPFEMTWSCYCGGTHPCGQCDACLLRKKGFEEAGIKDPTYRHEVSVNR